MCETDHFNLTQMFKIEMAAGILPWSVDDSGQLVLLLGREADTGHWAGFGGARDRGESLYDTALREGYEESMGLIDGETVRNSTSVRPYNFGTSLTLVVHIPYNASLPTYFHQFYRYSDPVRDWAPEGWFEKDSVRWVTMRALRTLHQRNQLRPYMREQLPTILRDLLEITSSEI